MRGMRECSANVIPPTLFKKFKKGSFYCPFFLHFLDTSFYKPLNSSVTIRHEANEAKKNITN